MSRPLDPLAREEPVGGIDLEGERRGHEVHRDDDLRLNLADDLLGALGVKGVDPADGDHQNVHIAEGGGLLLAELVAQVAHVADPDAVHLEGEDGVFAPEPSSLLIVICGNALKLDPSRGLLSGTPDHLRFSSDRSDVVVVVVVVADGDDVRLHLWVGVADGLVEGVCYDDLPRAVLDLEAGVSEPGYLQNDHPLQLLTSKDNNHSGGAVVRAAFHSGGVVTLVVGSFDPGVDDGMEHPRRVLLHPGGPLDLRRPVGPPCRLGQVVFQPPRIEPLGDGLVVVEDSSGPQRCDPGVEVAVRRPDVPHHDPVGDAFGGQSSAVAVKGDDDPIDAVEPEVLD